MLLMLLAGIVVAALAHTAPFPFLLDAQAGDLAMWRAPSPAGTPAVYLTFDDGPNPEATPALLDVLARENVTATFFLIDRWVTDETAPIVRRMFADGHSVALHSHTRSLMLMSPEGLARALDAQRARIERLAGGAPCRAFRPHAGWRSGAMYEGLARAGYELVGWGYGLWDWNAFRPRTADAIAPRLIKRAGPGSILVIHDGHHENPRADRRYAVETTERLIPALRARGFRFAGICEALSR
jgi:chitooligosaccharide deacetylase